jgi:hypothetical protein
MNYNCSFDSNNNSVNYKQLTFTEILNNQAKSSEVIHNNETIKFAANITRLVCAILNNYSVAELQTSTFANFISLDFSNVVAKGKILSINCLFKPDKLDIEIAQATDQNSQIKYFTFEYLNIESLSKGQWYNLIQDLIEFKLNN